MSEINCTINCFNVGQLISSNRIDYISITLKLFSSVSTRLFETDYQGYIVWFYQTATVLTVRIEA